MHFLNIEQKASLVLDLLKKQYPIVSPFLIHSNEWELLIAVILSAQTLDASVNKVTPKLFGRYPAMHALADASQKDVELIIKGLNYYKTKSKNIILTSQKLISEFNSRVPNTMDELLKLHGVGRKTANVVLGQWFKINEGIVVDTHVKRVSKRLGFTNSSDPIKIEQDLMKLFPQKEWNELSLRFVLHGRNLCTAKKNMCCEDEVWKKLCDCN